MEIKNISEKLVFGDHLIKGVKVKEDSGIVEKI